jgi:hypothetical protein
MLRYSTYIWIFKLFEIFFLRYLSLSKFLFSNMRFFEIFYFRNHFFRPFFRSFSTMPVWDGWVAHRDGWVKTKTLTHTHPYRHTLNRIIIIVNTYNFIGMVFWIVLITIRYAITISLIPSHPPPQYWSNKVKKRDSGTIGQVVGHLYLLSWHFYYYANP